VLICVAANIASVRKMLFLGKIFATLPPWDINSQLLGSLSKIDTCMHICIHVHACTHMCMQMTANGQVVFKERCLLLFSNMILCAAMRRRKKKGAEKKKEELESTTGSRYGFVCACMCKQNFH